MPLARAKPPGTAAEPLAATARLVFVESKVPMELEQLLVEQISKVSLPVSCVSGSLKVAVSVGVVVLSLPVSAGETSAGVEGEAFVVLLAIEALFSVAVLDALPVVRARSLTIGLEAGFV